MVVGGIRLPHAPHHVGCVNLKYYNESGEVDAEIIIRPTEEAVQDTIESGEIHQGVSAEITIPISKN